MENTKVTTAEDMFREFAKKEGLHDVSFEESRDFVPYFRVTFSESGCCDHQSHIEVSADDRISFDKFRCDVENLELLNKAIYQKMKEKGWMK